MKMSSINKISLDDLILEISFNDNIIFFVGSAVSMSEPTNIPTGKELTLNILKALTKEHKRDFLQKYYDIFKQNLESTKEFLNIPLERVLSYIWSILDESKKEEFFNCINLFISAPPNGFHEILADITSKNKDKTIITTNFDIAIEKAFKGKKIIITEKNIKKINCKVPNNGIKIIKLHGSWELTDTLIFTLEQEGKGLHFEFRDYLKKNLDNKIVCFIGYSASDFDIYPILYEVNFEKVYWLIKANNGGNNRIEKILKKKPGYYFSCSGDIKVIYNKITNKKLTLKKSRECKELIDFLSRRLNLSQKYLLVAKIFFILLKVDKTIDILHYALRNLYKEKSFKKNKNELIHLLAGSYNQKGNLIKAHRYYKRYLEQIEGSQNESEKLFDANLNLVSSYIMMGNLNEARNKIEEIKNIRKNMKIISNKSLKNLERNEFVLKELIMKLDYNNIINKLPLKKVKRHKILNNLEGQIHNLKIYGRRKGNLDLIMDCNIYLSRIKWIQGECEEALKLLEGAIEFFKSSGNVMSMINAMRDKSRIIFSEGKIRKAIKIHEKILEISGIYGSDYLSIIKSRVYLAYYHALEHKYYNMVKYFFKAIKLILRCILTNKIPIELFFTYFKSSKNLLISR